MWNKCSFSNISLLFRNPQPVYRIRTWCKHMYYFKTLKKQKYHLFCTNILLTSHNITYVLSITCGLKTNPSNNCLTTNDLNSCFKFLLCFALNYSVYFLHLSVIQQVVLCLSIYHFKFQDVRINASHSTCLFIAASSFLWCQI